MGRQPRCAESEQSGDKRPRKASIRDGLDGGETDESRDHRLGRVLGRGSAGVCSGDLDAGQR
jgi:hypothetical protein